MNNHCSTVTPAFANARCWFALACALCLFTARGQAQSSVSTLEFVYTTNKSSPNEDGFLNSNSSSDGSAATAAGTQSFTGLDRAGNVQTMTFNGSVTASAQYGQLHSYASGTVTNTYYNAVNPAYVGPDGTINPAGSPDSLDSLGFAFFNDTLLYGGQFEDGYQARYIFHLSGTNSGYGSAASLDVKIAGHDQAFFAFNSGTYSTDWATMEYPINNATSHTLNVQFADQFGLNPVDVTDGSNISGVADFTDTLTLARIEITDANGNPVTGVTVTSASGTVYAVPEPGAFALLLPAACWLVCRRKRDRAAV